MRNIIKKILKEDENLDWIKDIDPSKVNRQGHREYISVEDMYKEILGLGEWNELLDHYDRDNIILWERGDAEGNGWKLIESGEVTYVGDHDDHTTRAIYKRERDDKYFELEVWHTYDGAGLGNDGQMREVFPELSVKFV